MPSNELHILSMTTKYSAADIFIILTCFPYPYGLISTASCQVLSLMTPSHTLNLIFMALQLGNALKIILLHFPNACSSIKTSTSQYFATRVPSQLSHCSCMSFIKDTLHQLKLDLHADQRTHLPYRRTIQIHFSPKYVFSYQRRLKLRVAQWDPKRYSKLCLHALYMIN